MTVGDLLAALDLLPSCRVDQRVPKKLLVENVAPTAADKRRISEGIEELHWLAALKPTTIGVPAYRDDARGYLEIAVLHLKLRPGAATSRLTELVHRAIPYPVLLLAEEGGRVGVSVAHKRWSQGEAGRTVLDSEVIFVELDGPRDTLHWPAFREALTLGRQPRANLHAVYQGWFDVLLALQAARLTGVFTLAASLEISVRRREALSESAQLEADAARLRSAAIKATQMAEQVALNLELKRVEERLTETRKGL